MASSSPRPTPLSQRYGALLSCGIACPGLSIERFLAGAEGQTRFYYASPNDELALAGAGTAVELIAWGEGRYRQIANEAAQLFAGAQIRQADNPLASPRLFGGFAFRSDFRLDNTWSIYAPAIFALPHYQLAVQGGQSWLTINTQIPEDEDSAALAPDLEAALQAKAAELLASDNAATRKQSAIQSINYPMTYDQWARMTEAATEGIRAGQLNKVVLARAAELRFSGRIRPLPILRYLAREYADCIRFHFEPRPYHAFYGASPELLAALSGKRLQTMALAGSIGRGKNGDDDQALGKALMQSEKDLYEHDIVVMKMRDRLQPFVEGLASAPMQLLKLSNIQHLHTPLHASLKRKTGILPLIEALHPTPALGGDPREKALGLIRELEPIPRGWYGAPIGWLDARLDGEFAVAIRSAVAQEQRAWIYAGAGIVSDSQPEAEWAETALKFRPMLEAHSYRTQRFSPQRHRGTEGGSTL